MSIRNCPPSGSALDGYQQIECLLPAQGPSQKDLALMKQIDQQYLATPFYGSRFWRQARPPGKPK